MIDIRLSENYFKKTVIVLATRPTTVEEIGICFYQKLVLFISFIVMEFMNIYTSQAVLKK